MSIFNEYKVNGKTIIVRTCTENDAENLLNLKKSYIKGSTSIPLYEHEYTNTIIEEAELIARYGKQENSVLLVAEYNSRLIGNLDLTGSQRQKLFHTAMLGMGIAYDWHNMKIGSLLLENAIGWAANESPLEIIWLDVYANNTPGRALYTKFGFNECGIMPSFVKDNVITDKISMIKYLHDV